MPQILTLHLVNDLGSDSIGGSQSDVPSLWPGTPTPYDFSLTPQAIRPVWVGVSADGVTNQVYPLSTGVPTIIGAGWPRVYQGTEIVGNHGDVLVFSEQYPHVLNALSACCNTAVASGAFVFRSGRYSLDPAAPPPPCGAEAIFKLLSVLGNPEAHALSYQWGFQLLPEDGDTDNQFNWFEAGDLTSTRQKLLPWATGFYDLVDSVDNTRFLVADDDPTVDPNAVRVGFYAGGTITLNVVVYDPEDESYFFNQNQTYRLPGTDCAEESGSSSSGESSSGSASASASSGDSASASFSFEMSPDELGERLFAWYDVTDESTLTTTPDSFEAPTLAVTEIRDKSANAFDLNVIDSLPPVWFPSGGSAGLPYIRTGNVRELVNGDLPAFDDDLVVFVVYKVVSAADGDIMNALHFSASAAMNIKVVNGTDRLQIGGGSLYGKPNSVNHGWQLLRFNYSDVAHTFFGVNDEPYDLSSYDRLVQSPITLASLTRLALGWRGSQAGAEFHQAEMVWVKGALNATEEGGLRNYFRNKYALAPNQYIAFYGDSITYGAQATNNDLSSFAALTCAALGRQQLNFAHPGRWVYPPNLPGTIGEPLGFDFIDKIEQLPTFDTSCISHLFVSYGTNDEYAASDPAPWKARYKQALLRLLHITQLPAAKLVIATPPYQSIRAADMPTLNTAMQEIGAEIGAVFYDAWALTFANGGDALLADGTHPNDAGHVVYADGLIPLLT